MELTELNEKTFSEFAQRYSTLLKAYIQTICANATDAEDICQESYRKAFLNLNSYNPAYSFKTWLFSIARNTAIDHLRRKNSISTVNLNDAEEPTDETSVLDTSPEETMIDGQAYDQFLQSIRMLPDKYREPIELRLLHNCTYQEISDQLKLPLNTVRTRLRRAKLLLIETLKK